MKSVSHPLCLASLDYLRTVERLKMALRDPHVERQIFLDLVYTFNCLGIYGSSDGIVPDIIRELLRTGDLARTEKVLGNRVKGDLALIPCRSEKPTISKRPPTGQGPIDPERQFVWGYLRRKLFTRLGA